MKRHPTLPFMALLLLTSGGGWAEEYPLAGLKPDQRPAGAPVLTETDKGDAWHQQALTGVTAPHPQSLKFLDNQGGWYTPFDQPGMTGPYDLRGWHPPAQGESDYLRAKWNPIHFKPAIDQAKDEDCLACHKEVLEPSVRAASPAGLKASDSLAWYQTLDTYQGDQESFHRRHLVTPYAKQIMDLKCTTCHQGNDPRDETANASADGNNTLTQRKHVDPMICAQCHGKHNTPVMGLPPGDWRETGAAFQNNCLVCHAAIRTSRHQVNFLKADAIEQAAKENPDVCFGCHGGRAWYRINYPYPRHPWPGSGDAVPDWAKDRPTVSEARFLTGMQDSVTASPAKSVNP